MSKKETISYTNCIIDDNSQDAEYSALRQEKLYRYEYSNKLFSDTITFSSAVIAAVLGIYAFMGENLYTNQSIMLEYIQLYLLFLPVLFSGITFSYSIENSIRINYISDYIRNKSSITAWEKRKENNHYFFRMYFRNGNIYLGTHSRVGDLLPTHMTITYVCLLISSILSITLLHNCVLYNFQNKTFQLLIEIVYSSCFIFVFVGISFIKFRCFKKLQEISKEVNNIQKKEADKKEYYISKLQYSNQPQKKFSLFLSNICYIKLGFIILLFIIYLFTFVFPIPSGFRPCFFTYISHKYNIVVACMFLLTPLLICTIYAITPDYLATIEKANIQITLNKKGLEQSE